MNVLFLAPETAPDNKRDTVTYNFIVKEMVALREHGVNVVFLSFSGSHGKVQGVPVIAASSLLEESKVLKKIRNGLFLIRNLAMLGNISWRDLPWAIWRAYCDRAILACVVKHKIDIIHTHFFVPDGGGGTVVKKYRSVPIIATCRGAEICNMPELDYGAMRCGKYQASLVAALPFFDAITVPNRFYKEKVIHDFPLVDPTRVMVLYNGVERISVVRNQQNLSDFPSFICIGKLIPLKNYELVLRAVDLLRGRYEFKVILVGDGVLKEKFTELIREHYRDYVILQNEVPKTDLFKMLANADCLVHPSFSEGGANVILEALAIGVPCIVSDILSMQKEIIQEGVNGFFFDPKNPAELADKMEYAINNREKIWKMEKSCCISVEPYTLENKINGYLGLYHKLAGIKEI